jgi:predicted nucleic acid-binding protein
MMYYFDSSAVVKRYALETGSAWAKSVVAMHREAVVAAHR